MTINKPLKPQPQSSRYLNRWSTTAAVRLRADEKVEKEVIAHEGLAVAEAPTMASSSSRRADLRRILGLSVPISVTLAERDMSLESILSMSVGTILEFDVPVEAELKLYAVNCEIARGQAVKVGESFGFRITRIVDVHDRIGALGGNRPKT